MADINELIGKLTIIVNKQESEGRLKAAVSEIEKFFTESMFLNEHEVAIFLANKEKTVLSFACPEYLVNSGMIPVSSTEAFTSSIFRSGRGLIENNVQQQRHLSLFEIIRTPDGDIKPVWKIIGSVIAVENEKIGVIEISRRSPSPQEMGEDFTERDLQFVENTMKRLAPLLKKVMPEDFRGKIT